MNPREHALFRRYPLADAAMTSQGRLPTPYHVYDGQGLFIGGQADLQAVRELLAPEQVHAVATRSGHALMGLWIFDFTDASLGPHHELQVSLFVSREPLAPVSAHPLALPALMATQTEVRMLCHGLWNSTPKVVAYNRELLHLDARVSRSDIEHHGGRMRFSVSDHQTMATVAEGDIEPPRRSSWSAGWSLLWQIGLQRMGELARQPWIGVPVLNPVSEGLPRNAEARTFTKAQTSALRRFDPVRDRLRIADPRYGALRFEPRFVQFMDGFKFVYLFPQ